MIKINLIEKKKKFVAPVVLGVDLSKIPVKKIFLSVIFTQIPLMLLTMYTDSLTESSKEKFLKLKGEETALKKEVKKNKKIAEQLDVFNEQIADLKKRGEQVNSILKTKTNPRFVLESIARVMPESIWLNKLVINNERSISLYGGSEDYRGIGSFIKQLNDTAYFNKKLQLKNSTTQNEVVGKKQFRFEAFEIVGLIDSFNPFLDREKK